MKYYSQSIKSKNKSLINNKIIYEYDFIHSKKLPWTQAY